MENGLYEMLVNKKIDGMDKQKYIRNIDNSELNRVISMSYEKILRKKLAEIEGVENKEEFLNKLNEIIGIESIYRDEKGFKELLSIHDEKEEIDKYNENRPRTSLASSTLFTGTSGPTLESELSREIRTSEEIYFLVSFIKYSGLRLIYDDLVEFTKENKLRIITTSYMGASDYKAILELSKLPNTKVKISYDTNRTRLHAKAYYFKRSTGFSTAYIGSSNLSNPALSNGLEWNLKVSEYTSKDVMNSFIKTFETYWNDDEFVEFDETDEIERENLKRSLNSNNNIEKDYVFFELRPYSHQKQILEDLELERLEFHSNKNLVVAATGTGKTMIAAFDYKNQLKNGHKKLLFLAHRKEILEQGLFTFRNVLRDQNFGELWVDGSIPVDNKYVFASIQTLTSNNNYEKIDKNYYDYIVLDESHHASASSYLKIIDYFKPQIILGLTATPERMDGKNILEHFNNRIASEIRLSDAIDKKLLSPFHYFGVTDSEDLSNLKWTRGGYEINELENVYTKSKQRVQIIIDAMNKYLKDIYTFKGIGFCVSIKHADYMSKSFNDVGIKSVSIHSKTNKEERNLAKKLLKEGKLNCIFTVDLFNEGVDIPDIDTVLFLRPTESLTVFIQQLGRGLRLAEGKEALTVLDFIGQSNKHYDFTFKLRSLIGRTSRNIKEEINDDFPNMPAGCHIKLEKIAKEHILKNIQASIFNVNDLRNMMGNFSNRFSNELNLYNFLENYGISKERFYSKYSFYDLLNQVGIKKEYLVEDKKELRQALRRFSKIDSKRLLEFAKKLYKNDLIYKNLIQQEKIMYGMLHYTIWGDKPKESYEKSLKRLKTSNIDIINEILDIIDYNLKKIKFIEKAYSDKSIPLDIYASYNLEQILVAFKKTTEIHKFPLRQGVCYVKEKNTDLLFITINKNEEDYLPTTMYNDYAKNSKLFNWETQSTTSLSSKTGQRYIYGNGDNKVLLFVREMKKEYGNPMTYTFLGEAKYYSHYGDKPIQIVWEMTNSIPEKIIIESKLKVVN